MKIDMHGAMLFGAILAAGTQWLNTHKPFPSWIGKLGLLAIGYLWYAGNVGFPHSDVASFQGWFAEIVDWLEDGFVAAAALPGAASLIGLLPGMKTDSRSTTPGGTMKSAVASVLMALSVALLAVSLPVLCAPARAADLYGSFGGQAVWLDGGTAAWPVDAEASGNLWAPVTDHLDIGANINYGFSHSYLSGSGYANVTATDIKNRDFSIGLRAEYRSGSIVSFQPSEWAFGATVGWVPLPAQFPRFMFAGTAMRGQKTDGLITRLSGKYWFPVTF